MVIKRRRHDQVPERDDAGNEVPHIRAPLPVPPALQSVQPGHHDRTRHRSRPLHRFHAGPRVPQGHGQGSGRHEAVLRVQKEEGRLHLPGGSLIAVCWS